MTDRTERTVYQVSTPKFVRQFKSESEAKLWLRSVRAAGFLADVDECSLSLSTLTTRR